MTLPILVQNYQEKVTVNKLKKMYSVLSQAYNTYKIDNPSPELLTYDRDSALKAFNIFKPYLKIAKDCGNEGDVSGCLYSGKYKKLSGVMVNDSYASSDKYYKVLLADGSALVFRGGEDSMPNLVSEIFYDINGDTPPNMWGKDLFEFDVYKDKVVASGTTKESFLRVCISEDGSYQWGSGCTAWVIQNENMDYLKCPEKLGWDKKSSCK